MGVCAEFPQYGRIGVTLQVLHFAPMPTKHRRINVTCDGELQAAMRKAAGHIDAGSDAGLLREMAIAGARSLPDEPVDEVRARILAIPGVIPRQAADLDLSWLDEIPREKPSMTSEELLRWVRSHDKRP